MNFSEGIQPDFFICRRDAIEIEIYFIRSKKVIMTNSSINHWQEYYRLTRPFAAWLQNSFSPACGYPLTIFQHTK